MSPGVLHSPQLLRRDQAMQLNTCLYRKHASGTGGKAHDHAPPRSGPAFRVR